MMNRDRLLPVNDQKGAALLFVIFIVGLLMILAAEFAFTTRMEISAAINFKDDIEGYYYALAGFQYGLTEIIGKYDGTYLGPDNQVGFYRKWYHDENQPENPNPEVQQEWPPIPNRTGIQITGGGFDYIITDEQGRLNINYLESRNRQGSKTNREIFYELLVETGVEAGEQADIIVDSVIDWVDRNDLHLLNGAESDWYEHNYEEQGFTEPYNAKNGRIDTLDELLMIRGITPEILYGSNSIYSRDNREDEKTYAGIAPYITVYGYHRVINKDTAPPLLLRILDPDTAEEELENRQYQTQGRQNSSRTFRIEVRGYKLNSSISHNLMAVVRRSFNRNTGGGAEIIYWNDDAPTFGQDLTQAATTDQSADKITHYSWTEN
ncbi:general secretion pathway protein GspK [bacterium]|nr:general secretion pathway protein GspK [candidate division CSSED10-310 bacterium]